MPLPDAAPVEDGGTPPDFIQTIDNFHASRGGLVAGEKDRNYRLLLITAAALILLTLLFWWLAGSERFHFPGWLELTLFVATIGTLWYLVPSWLVRPEATAGAKAVIAGVQSFCGHGGEGICDGNDFARRFPEGTEAIGTLDRCLDGDTVRSQLAEGANPECAARCTSAESLEASESTRVDAEALLFDASTVVRFFDEYCPIVRDAWRREGGVLPAEWAQCQNSLAKSSTRAANQRDWGLRRPWLGIVVGLLWGGMLLFLTGSATGVRQRRYAGSES